MHGLRTTLRYAAGSGISRQIQFLDTISVTPLVALGVTKLRAAHTGPILRVHDGTTNHDVAGTGEIAAACGANPGTVSTWYDQSGNGRDYTEGTNRPQIWTGAALEVEGTDVVVAFDGSNDKLARSDALGLTGAPALTIAYVAKQSGNQQAWGFGGTGAGTNVFYSQDTDASATRIGWSCFGGSRVFNCASRATYRSYIFQIAAGANISAATCWQSGSDLAQFSVSAAVPNITNTRARLGCFTADSGFTAIRLSYFFVWNAVLAGGDLASLKAFLQGIEA